LRALFELIYDPSWLPPALAKAEDRRIAYNAEAGLAPEDTFLVAFAENVQILTRYGDFVSP
jgi:hypothetical protein